MLRFGPRNPDAALVARLLRGDEAAFTQFFDTMFPRLYRFALPRLDQRQDAAEDVAQATLCQAVRRLDTWRGEASLFTWICAICRHEIDGWRRIHGKQTPVPLVEDAPEVRAALESFYVHDLFNTEAHVHRRDLATLVQRILDHLPVHYGNVLEWKYLEDQSVRDIATRLDMTEKATESLLTRARAAFRDLISAIAPELAPRPQKDSPGGAP